MTTTRLTDEEIVEARRIIDNRPVRLDTIDAPYWVNRCADLLSRALDELEKHDAKALEIARMNGYTGDSIRQ